MSRSVVREAPKKKKTMKWYMPVLGLMLALLFAVVSYIVAPRLVEFSEEKSAKIETQLNDFRESRSNGDTIIDIIATGLLWLSMLGMAMFLASAAIGKDPDKDSFKNMPASPANKKQMIKQLKRDLKAAEQRAKQQKKAQPKK